VVRLPRPRPWWLALSSLALTAIVVISPGTQAAAISTVAAGACATGALGLRAAMTPGRARQPWTLLTLAVTVLVLGAAIWEVYALLGRGRPAVSPADGLYLFAYPLIACAIGLLVVIRTPQGWRDGLVDGAAIAISAGLAIWQFLIVNTGLIDDGELFQRAVLASYPLLDVVLVAALLWLLLMPGRRCVRVVPQHRPRAHARGRPRPERRGPAQPRHLHAVGRPLVRRELRDARARCRASHG
jgi:hypothetical protein